MSRLVFDQCVFFFFQAEDGIRDTSVTGVQTCALPISGTLPTPDAAKPIAGVEFVQVKVAPAGVVTKPFPGTATPAQNTRSEERRVGKECRCRWSQYN